MNKKIMFLMCLLLAMVWIAGCTCPGPRVAAAPAPVVEPAPPRLRRQRLSNPSRWRSLPLRRS